MKYFLITALMLAFGAQAQKRKVRYEYKKHEVFDFEALDVAGDTSSPGDLSISPRFRKKFRNKIPERQNFNNEMKRALDSVR
ncbi:MAG: hypothetical protein KC478_15005 [Bacteriovoracaceae bacterium]|nr:hypothetical protein [Bacteriovoracaceae bacterium]